MMFLRLTFLSACFAFTAGLAIAQNNTNVPQQLEQHVDAFTGDFHYEVPLLTVEGPNGEHFPIVAAYRSGIRMNQEASWIGLGWEVDLGEITREVKGVPDDWKGKEIEENEYNVLDSTDKTHHFYGPVHFKDLYTSPNANKKMDLYTSDRFLKQSSGIFEFPDYDGYYVSGPGISGEMSLHLFQFADIYHKSDSIEYRSPSATEFEKVTKRPVFRFNDEAGKMHLPRPYGTNEHTYFPFESIDDLKQYTEPFKPPYKVMDYYGSIDCVNDGGLGATTDVWRSRYVEYFTNDEIDDHKNSVAAITGGFYDYAAGIDRSSSVYDPDGIGAIRITSPEGLVYHYSLPVYTNAEVHKQIRLNGTFGASYPLTTYEKTAKYAHNWKLTAITGPDYVDVNNNELVDEGDKGYWISINYKRWTKEGYDFSWRSPYYGYEYSIQRDQRIPRLTGSNFQNYYFAGIVTNKSTFKRTANVNESELELFYPFSVKTATQTAFFVYDVRDDAHSVPVSGKKTPRLHLTDIVLFNNYDVDNLGIFSSYTGVSSTDYSGLSTIAYKDNFISRNGLNSELPVSPGTKRAAVLKAVELEQDYHLCPLLYNNIHNSFTLESGNPGTIAGKYVYDLVDTYSGSFSNMETRGKLTLNQIQHYETGMEKIRPPYEFTYENSLDAYDNPEYNHEYKDYFGFYKKTYRPAEKGGYCTSGDKDNVDAWSLRKIVTPMQEELEIEYESDAFVGIGFDTKGQIPERVERTFPIKSVSIVSESEIEVDMYDSDASILIKELLDDYEVDDEDELTFYFKYQCITAWGTWEDPDNTIDYACSEGLNLGPIHNITTNPSDLDFLVFQDNSSNPKFAICSMERCIEAREFENNGDAYVKVMMSKAYGGGARVKSIKTSDGMGHTYKLDASYDEGIATAEPDPFGPERFHVLYENQVLAERHAQPVNVGYSKVSFQHGGSPTTLGGGKSVYTFNNYLDTYNPHRLETSGFESVGNRYHVFEVLEIDERNSMYGKPREMAHYDAAGNVVEKTVLTYGDHITDHFGQSVEAFYRYMSIDSITTGTNPPDEILVNSVFIKKKYQNFLRRKTVYKDGITLTTDYEERDPVSGEPTVTLLTDEVNGTKRIETTPAFRVHAEMGPKSESTGTPRYNMLTGTATQKVLHVGSTNILIDGFHTVWSNNNKLRSYNAGNNEYETTDETTTWKPLSKSVENGNSSTASWKVVEEAALSLDNLRVVSKRGPNQTYTAQKYEYDMLSGNKDCHYVSAEAVNCNYTSFTHTSFETTREVETGVNHFDGEVLVDPGKGSRTTGGGITAHTGDYYVTVPASTVTGGPRFVGVTDNETVGSVTVEHGLHRGRTYRASVWVHQSSPAGATLHATYSGSSTYAVSITKASTEAFQVGNWLLLSLNIILPPDYNSEGGSGGGSFTVSLRNTDGSQSAYFDDFRVHPVDAGVTAYVTDQRRGLVTHVINNENFYSRIEYDAAGKPHKTYQETANGEKLRSVVEYDFAN